ncbi:hypothetical protein PILCRDRAFT_344379 [Piloderma croceum F 1598]|uniref:Uncharacterized protein n=1 Tax=Piloderma croceum (strain F 1598) TaxID=765440 RepID=A0A0C3G567_PILCF|nr:hypothetical protein PILCRDRAFT_344379 [Piloderma croceum F 1598]
MFRSMLQKLWNVVPSSYFKMGSNERSCEASCVWSVELNQGGCHHAGRHECVSKDPKLAQARNMTPY